MEDETSWISAKMALTQLEVQFGGSAATKAMIADRMRDGRLKCRAKETWISDAINTATAWRTGPVGEVIFDAEIKPSVWKASKRWPADQSRWKWVSSRFSVTRRIRPSQRQMVVGVSFKLSEIEALKSGPVLPKSRKGIGGAIAKFEQRNAAWIAAMRMLSNDELQAFTSQKALTDALLSEINEELTEKPVREMVRLIAKEFCPLIK